MPSRILRKIRSGIRETDVEEYLDTLGLEEDDLLEEHANMWIRPFALEEVVDVERVNDELRKGNIVLLNIILRLFLLLQYITFTYAQ